jgi:hypothetical protein
MSIEQALLAPVFLHVLLTLIVGIITLRARYSAVKEGKASLKKIALDNSAWPEQALKLGNNLNNQFQVPIIWYACVALLLVAQKADWVTVALSWAFIATRLLHTLEHTRSNNVRRRMPLFLAGYACVVAMWVWFALRIYVFG